MSRYTPFTERQDCSPVDALDPFRAVWWRCQRFGIPFEGKLPAMPEIVAQEARRDAYDHYFRPCGHADLNVSKRLLDDTYGAIAAAVAEHDALKGRQSNNAKLRARLIERDGDACWLCGHELGDNCTIEHRQARANGGTWALSNLVLAHHECNRNLGRLPLAAKEAVRAVTLANTPRND